MWDINGVNLLLVLPLPFPLLYPVYLLSASLNTHWSQTQPAHTELTVPPQPIVLPSVLCIPMNGAITYCKSQVRKWATFVLLDLFRVHRNSPNPEYSILKICLKSAQL